MPRGRPPKPGWERFNIKLPSDIVQRIDAQAEKETLARSELLADGAEMYLKRAIRKPAKSPQK